MNKLYFVSDAHFLNLPDKNNYSEKKFEELINEIIKQKGELIVIGDIFDFWIEYKYFMPKYYFNVLHSLKKAAENGVKIHIICGNHDYWHLDFFKRFVNAEIFRNEMTISNEENLFYITHGDGVLKSDRGYRIIKPLMRNRILIKLLKCIHPDITMKAVNHISNYPRNNYKNHILTHEMKAELIEWAKEIAKEGYKYIVIGHYHTPFIKEIEKDKFLICIGDWLKHFTFGYYDDKNFSLCYWDKKNHNFSLTK
ncbi:MAG: UDP-2,3-diacylglucosamine diphosphatase [Candidatus Marinimicrobia bacterium]|nr:UDP-2,3-diacylglucosamine diphosphatase [Candidatus Neomarinimicrobiota bacterium]